MNDLCEVKTNVTNKKERKTLSVIFFDREGEPEMGSVPGTSTAFKVDGPSFITGSSVTQVPKSVLLKEAAASNRLRRALFETGQLCVTTTDGLSRVCFAGIGDPERLFIESVPREVPVPSMEFGFPGCLCSLEQAATILRRIYRGESSDRLAASLKSLAHGRRKRRLVLSDRPLRAA